MSVAHFGVLYEYNSWANRRILGACATVSEEQFTRDLRSSFPSVRETLAHIQGAEWVWLERCQGRSPRALPTGWELKTLADVQARWEELERNLNGFVEKLDAPALDRMVSYINFRGNRYAYPLKSCLRHLVNHGSYHRGQVTTMLRQLSGAPVATDLIVFYRERGAIPTEAAMDPEAVRVLFEANAWANHRLVDAAAALTPEQFTRGLGSSFASVRDTLAHILGAEWLWLERFQGTSPTSLLLAGGFPDVESLRRQWERVERGLLELVRGLSPSELARIHEYRTTKGVPSANPFWQMLQHLANHGAYHRGQVTTMLRQLGAQPPATDFLRYFDVLAGEPEE